MVTSIQTGHLASALCLYSVTVNSNESTGPLFSVLVYSNGNKKDSSLVLSFPVLLLQPCEEQCGILLSRFRCN